MEGVSDHSDDLKPHVHSAWCLLMSTTVLALTAVLTSSLRSLTRSLCRETLAAKCFLDLLCGLELCMCGFELGVILDIYDTPVYCVYLWLVLVWQGLAWSDASPSPHTHLVRYLAGSQSLVETAARTGAGLTGALASYTVMAAVWTWDLSHFHDNRELSTAASHCTGDLQVSIPTGMMIELLGSLICFLSGPLMEDIPSLATRPRLSLGLDSVLSVSLVMAGFDLTGGYYSPALALGTKLGCGQGGLVGGAEHLAVYWLAPCLGALLAQPVYRAARQGLVTSISDKKRQ